MRGSTVWSDGLRLGRVVSPYIDVGWLVDNELAVSRRYVMSAHVPLWFVRKRLDAAVVHALRARCSHPSEQALEVLSYESPDDVLVTQAQKLGSLGGELHELALQT